MEAVVKKKTFNIFLNHQNKYDWQQFTLSQSSISIFVLLKNDLLYVMLQIEEIISNVIENTNRSIKLNLTITYM